MISKYVEFSVDEMMTPMQKMPEYFLFPPIQNLDMRINQVIYGRYHFVITKQFLISQNQFLVSQIWFVIPNDRSDVWISQNRFFDMTHSIFGFYKVDFVISKITIIL